jgi:hypothetical protein
MSQYGAIYYSFVRSGQAIMADVYYADLRSDADVDHLTMLTKLAVKQPRLANRFHHYCSMTTRDLIQHEKPF